METQDLLAKGEKSPTRGDSRIQVTGERGKRILGIK